MMRLAGRSEDGTAKAVKSKKNGSLSIVESNEREKRISEISEMIGLEHLKMFLSFSDSDQVYRDFYKKQISFSGLPGKLPRQNGSPLGYYIKLENDHYDFMQNPLVQYNAGTTIAPFAKKLATKINVDKNNYIGSISMISATIKKIGTLSTNYTFSIYTDDNGKPGRPLPVRTLLMGDDTKEWGTKEAPTGIFRVRHSVLKEPVNTYIDKNYWLVLEYEDSSVVNASNCIQWRYGDDALGSIASYDGTDWTVTNGKTFNHGLFDNSLNLTGDISVLFLLRVTDTQSNIRRLFTATNQSNTSLIISASKSGIFFGHPSVDAHNYRTANLSEWCVLACTLGKYKSIDKMSAYVDGVLLTESSDYIGASIPHNFRQRQRGRGGVGLNRNLSIGMFEEFYMQANFPGVSIRADIGAVIVATKELDQQTVAKISNKLLLGGELL